MNAYYNYTAIVSTLMFIAGAGLIIYGALRFMFPFILMCVGLTLFNYGFRLRGMPGLGHWAFRWYSRVR